MVDEYRPRLYFVLLSFQFPSSEPHLLSANALPFPKQQILNSSKLKKFADDNFKFDDDCKKFSR